MMTGCLIFVCRWLEELIAGELIAWTPVFSNFARLIASTSLLTIHGLSGSITLITFGGTFKWFEATKWLAKVDQSRVQTTKTTIWPR